jgi:hypothetical protein
VTAAIDPAESIGYAPSSAKRHMMKNTKRILGDKALDPQITKVYDVYHRASEIYRRSQQALGRTPKYRVTSSSTTSVRIQHGTRPHKTT